METWIGDLRVSVRQLVKSPGFTVAAVVVLALGIGLNAGMFSIVYAMGMMGRPFAEPERLVQLYSSEHKEPDSYRAFSHAAYAELAAPSDVFAGVLAHNPTIVGISDGGSESRRMFGVMVSRNYFEVLGVPIIRGRAFTEEESLPGRDIPVAIASYAYWQRAGFADDFVGRTIRVNERPFTIVGVTPRGFTGTMTAFGPELFFPFGVFHSIANDFEGESRRTLQRADAYNLFLVARLRDGVTHEAAAQRFGALEARLQQAYPVEYQDARLTAHALPRFGTSTSPSNEGSLGIFAAVMLGLTGAVLLTVCLNLASMLMARGRARRKEFAIRLALGASRGRVIRQLLVEGFLLSLAGGAAGLALGLYGVNALVNVFAGMLPISIVLEGAISPAVIAATVFFCGLATIWFALGPALRHSRADVLPDLKQQAGEDRPVRRRFMPRNPLVVGQVALSLALLIAAALFVRMAQTAMWVDFGYQADETVIAEVDSKLAGFGNPQTVDLYARIERRLQAIPGVQAAAVGSLVPLGMINMSRAVQRDGINVPEGADPQTPETGRAFYAAWNSVSGGYFAAMGVPVLQGRTFTDIESFNIGGSGVAILDEALARKLWPNGDALGQRVRFRREERGAMVVDMSYHVVGIVATTRRELFEKEPRGAVYLPYAQGIQGNAYFHVRPAAATTTLADTVRREIKAEQASLPLFSVRTFQSHISQSIEYWALGLAATLFASFGGLAMVVALVGIYGVMSYSVARRTREIGIRMAVGAHAGSVRGMILRESLAMTLAGLSAGWVLGVGVGQLLASVFVDLAGFDLFTFTVVPATFMATALAAAWLPARRATLINPVTALRSE